MKIFSNTPAAVVFEQDTGTVQELINLLATLPDEVRQQPLTCCGADAFVHIRKEEHCVTIDTEDTFCDEDPKFEDDTPAFSDNILPSLKYEVFAKNLYLTWEEADQLIAEWGKKFFSDYPIDNVEFELVMNTDQIVILKANGTELGITLETYIMKLVELYGKGNCDYDAKHDLHYNGTYAYTHFSEEMSKNVFSAVLADVGLEVEIKRLICDEYGIAVMGN